MPIPGLGFKSYIQFAPEAIFGVSPTFMTSRLELISENITPQAGAIPDPSLNVASSRRGLYEGGKIYKGTFVIRCNYDGMEELFRGLVGSAGYNTTILESTGSGTGTVYYAVDHVYTESANLTSYSIEIGKGDIPIAAFPGRVFKLYGAKFTSVTIRGTAGQGTDAMLQCEVGVIARDMQSSFVPSRRCADVPAVTVQAAPNDNTLLGAANIFQNTRLGDYVSGAFIPAGTQIVGYSVAGAWTNPFLATTVHLSARSTDGAAHLNQTIAFYCGPPVSNIPANPTAGGPVLIAQPGPAFSVTNPTLFHQSVLVDDGTTNQGPFVSAVGTIQAAAPNFTMTGNAPYNTVAALNLSIGNSVFSISLPNRLDPTTPTTISALPGSNTVNFTPVPVSSGTVTLGFQGQIRLRSFEFTLENPHAEDRFYMGDDNPDEPIRNDFLIARWRFTQEFNSVAAFTAVQTWPAGALSPKMIIRSPMLMPSSTTNLFQRELEIHSNKAQITEWSAPVEGYGVIVSTSTMEAFYDNTDLSAFYLRLRTPSAPLS